MTDAQSPSLESPIVGQVRITEQDIAPSLSRFGLLRPRVAYVLAALAAIGAFVCRALDVPGAASLILVGLVAALCFQA